MELWFTEKHSPDLNFSVKVKETLVQKRSQYQDLALLETDQFGRVLVLDGILQTTEKDEFVYHEMITNIPLRAHPCPRRVLVIGGGDGGTIREVLKHETVTEAVLVEIDEEVIKVAREFLPELSVALDDQRCRVEVTDGIEFVKQAQDTYDVIIIDSTDPVGPATGLVAVEFYRAVASALTANGMFVAQTESPFINPQHIRNIYNRVSTVFSIARVFTAAIPTYPSGLWAFTMGSKTIDPAVPAPNRAVPAGLKYYSDSVHQAAFALPPFVADLCVED